MEFVVFFGILSSKSLLPIEKSKSVKYKNVCKFYREINFVRSESATGIGAICANVALQGEFANANLNKDEKRKII